jgi:uncharacterized protein YegP (UPF0339 family)
VTAHACRWEICRSIDGLYFARFIGANGRKIWTTETYKRKRAAHGAIDVVEMAVAGDHLTERRDLTREAT